jgi:UDP-glucose:(indol-3-yl)acetate beta-D-glucosyltransferase
MHPAVACFISHCGWNSTLETLVTGVPVIGWPSWTDQPTNAKLIENVFKNGVKVNHGENGVASVEEIERCIRDVMEGSKADEFKKKAMEIKESARKALQEGGSSSKNFNKFISELIVENNPRVVKETSETKINVEELQVDSQLTLLMKFEAQKNCPKLNKKRNFNDI